MPNASILLQLDLMRIKMSWNELILLWTHWMNAEMPYIASTGSEIPPTAINGCDVYRNRTRCLFLSLTQILMVAANHKSWPPK